MSVQGDSLVPDLEFEPGGDALTAFWDAVFLGATSPWGATFFGATFFGVTFFGVTFFGVTFFGVTFFGATFLDAGALAAVGLSFAFDSLAGCDAFLATGILLATLDEFDVT